MSSLCNNLPFLLNFWLVLTTLSSMNPYLTSIFLSISVLTICSLVCFRKLQLLLGLFLNFPTMGSNNQLNTSKAFTLLLLCHLGLAAAYVLAYDVYSWSLVTHPADTLRLFFVVNVPIVMMVYSMLRQDPEHCSFLKAVARGFLAVPVGALLNAFGAVVLGAPVGIGYLSKTTYWSLLMSLFTLVPVTCVFGLSRAGWQCILLAQSKPMEVVDYMIILPAYGAIIGAWLGAWPMPLDWERPWQEWPICVTYGAVAGYFIGTLLLPAFILATRQQVHAKGD